MSRKNLVTALLFCLLVSTRSVCAQTPTPAGTPSEAFRDPFTVKFQFDDKHKVERRFDKTPYATQNNLDKTLEMEAWMLLPEYKEPVKTCLAPVFPHLMGIETWPQPIVKRELRIQRLTAPQKGFARTPQ